MRGWLPPRFDRTPRAVWWALGAGVIGYVLVLALVTFPVLGLVVSTVGAAGPVVHIPWLRIGVVLIAGNVLAWGLLVVTALSRHGPVAWVASVAAVIAVLVVSVYPAGAAAFAVAGDAQNALPTVIGWIARIRQTLGW